MAREVCLPSLYQHQAHGPQIEVLLFLALSTKYQAKGLSNGCLVPLPWGLCCMFLVLRLARIYASAEHKRVCRVGPFVGIERLYLKGARPDK